ncbi:hypothetical protein MMC20_006232 [Loxospora ochrophaea]|nr:hypothetical protein [Loxospora ochrophaea]
MQCDEAQPICQRCIKSQRICQRSGARRDGFIVHAENVYASGQRKRPRGPRSTPAVEVLSSLNAVLQRPLVDLKTHATGYYFHYHLQTLEDLLDISKSFSDDFLPIWMSRAECPILDLAVSSMALAVFSQTQRYPPAAREASKKYHELLQIAQATLPYLDNGNVDVYLLMIFFMSRYEDTVYRPSSLDQKLPITTRSPSSAHHDGALAVLKFWKDNLSHSQPATDIIKHTRRGMIRSALLRNLALPEWIQEGAVFGEYGLGLQYDRIVVQITNIRHQLSALHEGKTGSPCTSPKLIFVLEELNNKARKIDTALQEWATGFPSIWHHQRHTLLSPHPWPMRDFYSTTAYEYLSPAYAAVWNQYYATRILINSTRLKVLQLSPDSDPLTYEQRSECRSQMETMSNDLASSIPFCLERFKVIDGLVKPNANDDIKPHLASLVVWPLTLASGLEDVDIKQRSWFRSELTRLGKVVGAGVLECAETEPWLNL